MNSDLFEKYLNLNNSYRHTLTYTFGKTGFHSAINNMILTMVFCLKYKIRFRIYADDFIYFPESGWNQIFASQLPQTHNSFFKRYNIKSDLIVNDSLKGRYILLRHHLYQLLTGNNLVSSSFFECRTFWFSKEHFSFPELGIEGDLRDVCKQLASIVYVFNDNYREKMRIMESKICLPDQYVGIHIRRGDKIKEREYESIDNYISLAEKETTIRNAFILTDDFTIIEDLQNKYKGWQFYTLTFPYERGFVIGPSTEDKQRMDNELVKVVTSLDIMSRGQLFIGTVSTNPGMFLGMVMDRDKVKYIDANDWEIL